MMKILYDAEFHTVKNPMSAENIIYLIEYSSYLSYYLISQMMNVCDKLVQWHAVIPVENDIPVP